MIVVYVSLQYPCGHLQCALRTLPRELFIPQHFSGLYHHLAEFAPQVCVLVNADMYA